MKRFFTIKELTMIALFVALTAVLAQVIIPLPFTPLPVSFGLVAVYLSGLFLSPKCAIATQLIYLLMGGIGLPVFGGFQGGPGRLFGPTGGCLFAYPFMAAIISFALKQSSKVNTQITSSLYLRAFLGVFAALAIEYLFASAWLSITMGISLFEAAALAILPFIIVDIVKVLVTVLAFVPIRTQFFKAGILAPPKVRDRA